jgi:hypothetical protein
MPQDKLPYSDIKKRVDAIIGEGAQTVLTQMNAPNVPGATTVITSPPLSGGYTPYNNLSAKSQYNVQQPNKLTVIREGTSEHGTIGTLWHNGIVVGFTLEHPIRTTTIVGQTAIPKGQYNLKLDSTSRPDLRSNGISISTTSTPVIPRLLGIPGQTSNAIRIHAGTTKNDSEGCILFSKTRKPDRTNLVYSLSSNQELNQLIYNNQVTQIFITNEWENKK